MFYFGLEVCLIQPNLSSLITYYHPPPSWLACCTGPLSVPTYAQHFPTMGLCPCCSLCWVLPSLGSSLPDSFASFRIQLLLWLCHHQLCLHLCLSHYPDKVIIAASDYLDYVFISLAIVCLLPGMYTHHGWGHSLIPQHTAPHIADAQ